MRELLALTLGPLALAIICLACGDANGEVAPDSPAAQATATRRAEVAQVQRIIANNSTRTPEPAPTGTPPPTCENAIWWTDARSHIGESRTIQGMVISSRPAPGGAALLEIGQAYPDPAGIAVIVPSTIASPRSGSTVCVVGRIMLAEGRPTLVVNDATAIQTVKTAE